MRMELVLPMSGGSTSSAPASVPDAFVDADWSVAAGGADTELDVTIASLPNANGGPITNIGYSIDLAPWVLTGGTTSFTITGLTAATSYDVRLRAYNSEGGGPASNTESATTTGAASGDAALLENNDRILLESGDLLLLE